MTERAAAGPLRRLVVPRHAESARPKGVTDHERPPTTRVRRPPAPPGRPRRSGSARASTTRTSPACRT